jgi:hypothetical protein
LSRDPSYIADEAAGLTLEDRREARKERALRYMRERPEQAALIITNTVAQWQRGMERARVVDRYASDYAKVVGAVPNTPDTTTVDLPAITRRSRQDRLDAMIRRLKDMPPMLLEAKIREIQGEFFKVGMPVTYDDLRAVASRYLNRADTRRTPDIQVTRT